MPHAKRGKFEPESTEPYALSRSKIDSFLKCPRCFYLDRRLGIRQPSGPPFNLNKAVDTLLKKEFDIHRAKNTIHPLMAHYGIDALPFQHDKMDEWRNTFKGVRYLHPATNFEAFGAIDDVWVDPNGSLIIVDYKATSKKSEINLDAPWQISYKRQMEIYQWLFRKNGFTVSDTGYFVYCNGRTDAEAFDAKLEFEIHILPYTGKDDWVDDALIAAHECLMGSEPPPAAENCEFCAYVQARRQTNY